MSLVRLRLSKVEILHLTRLPYLGRTVFLIFCVLVPFRAASLGSNIYMLLFDQCYCIYYYVSNAD